MGWWWCGSGSSGCGGVSVGGGGEGGMGGGGGMTLCSHCLHSLQTRGFPRNNRAKS